MVNRIAPRVPLTSPRETRNDKELTQFDEYLKHMGIKPAAHAAASLPKKDGKHTEGDGYISEDHIHNMALRKMTKLFLSCLWLMWREAENLPIRNNLKLAKEVK